MRLLEKKQIQALKSDEKRLDIEQGMALATKVDALRKALATEQMNLEKFRTGTIKEVQRQIDQKMQELDSLNRMVYETEQKRIENSMPLMARYKKLQAETELLDQRRDDLSKKEYEVRMLNESNEKRQKALEIEKHEAEIDLARAKNDGIKANRMVEDAQKLFKDALEERRIAKEYASKTIKSARIREEKAALEELYNQKVIANLRLREGLLVKRELEITDRYQTLLRDEQRLTK